MVSGKVLLGVLTGVAVGALAGILFAPEKGSVTRKKLSKRGDDYVDFMKEKFDDFLESLTDKFEIAEEEVSSYAVKGKAKLNEVIEEKENGKYQTS